MESPDKRKKPSMPVIGIGKLNEMALKLLIEYMPEFLTAPAVFDIDRLINDILCLPLYESDKIIENIMGFILLTEMNYPIIGSGDQIHERGTIILNIKLRDNPIETRYTKAHEVAHYLIFNEYKSYNSKVVCCYKDNGVTIGYTEDEEKLEKEADVLANLILMPIKTFIPCAKKIMDKYGFNEYKMIGNIRIEEQKKVINEIAAIYAVPDYSVMLHLSVLDLYAMV